MARKEPACGPTRQQLLETLQTLSPGASDIRREQKQVIDCILEGRDVLAIFPTGSGKSVCYQVPAMHLNGLTLVISPLLALMEDQVQKLLDAGIPVACLASEFMADRRGFHYRRKKVNDEKQEDEEAEDRESAPSRRLRNRIFQDACDGVYKLLYVTPERLRQGSFIRFAQQAPIRMIAVDEAHCISLWGHQFRPRYREVMRLIRRMGRRPVIAAFTATATQAVREDIIQLLGMRRCKVVGGEDMSRPELRFSVSRFSSEEERRAALLRFLRDPVRRGKCGFVYCSTVDTVNEIFQFLLDHHFRIARYYAELNTEEKERNFQVFMRGQWPVMVTTSALGMGIDKPDIRFVLHYNMPLSLEDYYQQAGRAGRDGRRAECVLYYSEEDIKVCHFLVRSSLKQSDFPEESGALARRRLNLMEEYARSGVGRDSRELQEQILDYFKAFRPTEKSERVLRKAVLEQLRTVDVLYVNRTKIAQRLRKGKMEGTDLPVGRARGGRPAPTVTYRVTEETLTYFDLMVADAVYTLMQHRVSAIYAKNVMELLSGDGALLLRPDRRAEVEAGIRKMMRARIVIDRHNSSGCGFVYAGQGDKRILEGPFLPLFEQERGFGYNPDVLPPLYEYAEIFNGQFFSFPTRELKAEGLPATDRNLIMTHYLLCRIGMMPDFPSQFKEDRGKTCHKISFQSLLHAVDPRPPDRPRRERDTRILWERMLTILEHFKQTGAIAGFEIETPYRSVSIRLHGKMKK